MSCENSEADAKRAARFEAKVLRKRFLFRTAKRQDRRFQKKSGCFLNNAIMQWTGQEWEERAGGGKIRKSQGLGPMKIISIRLRQGNVKDKRITSL